MNLSGIQARLIRRLPLWVRSAPLDATLCVLGIPAGALAVIGIARSASLNEFLPGWGRLLWSAALFFGCLLWFIGLTSMRRVAGHILISRMPAMIFGLYLVSMSALVYGVALIVISGWAGLLAAWPVFVLSAGTYLRRVELVSRFRRGTEDAE